MSQQIQDVFFSMMPDSKARLSYKDSMLFYDNINCEPEHGDPEPYSFSDKPMFLRFSMVIYCAEGEICVSANLREYVLHSGDIFVAMQDSIVAGMRFSKCCRLICMCLTNGIEAIFSDAEVNKTFLNRLFLGPMVASLTDKFANLFVAHYHQMCFWVKQEDMKMRDLAVKGTYLTMASMMLEVLDVSRTPVSRAEQLYLTFMDLVRSNFREQRELSFYASEMCITPKYLGKVVKDYSGHKPGDLIRDYVILEAKALLRSGQYSVKQIADMLHFVSPSFFGRYFRESVGCSPLKY